jgi:hypothetical protein
MPRHLLVAASLLATALAYFLLAAYPFNWTGGDEWGGIGVASQGIVSCSHCKRIALVYNWLAYQISPGTLWGFRILGALSLWTGGLALYAIGQRLFPGRTFLAIAWAVFYVVFLTRDTVKLFPVYTATYAFSVTMALWAIALYVESWARGSRVWLLAALTFNVLAVSSYETSICLLLLPPIVLALVAPWQGRRTVGWVAAWYVVLALGALRYAIPALEGDGVAYQKMYAPLPLRRWPHVFELQLLRHFGVIEELSLGAFVEHWTVVLAVLAASAPLLVLARRDATDSAPAARRTHLVAVVGLGLVCVVAGVAPYAVIFGGNPGRAHYYSTPGAVLMVVGVLALVVSFAGARWRRSAFTAIWLGFVVTFTALSAEYRNSYWWDRQTALIRQLTELVPATREGALIVLLEPPADPTFRHPAAFYYVVHYLYGSATTGISDTKEQVLLDVNYSPAEIHIVPKSWAAGLAISEARFPIERVIFVDESLEEGLSIAKHVPPRFDRSAGERYQPDDSIIRSADAQSARRLAELSGGSSEAISTKRLIRAN